MNFSILWGIESSFSVTLDHTHTVVPLHGEGTQVVTLKVGNTLLLSLSSCCCPSLCFCTVVFVVVVSCPCSVLVCRDSVRHCNCNLFALLQRSRTPPAQCRWSTHGCPQTDRHTQRESVCVCVCGFLCVPCSTITI